jgi:hypothetical protein
MRRSVLFEEPGAQVGNARLASLETLIPATSTPSLIAPQSRWVSFRAACGVHRGFNSEPDNAREVGSGAFQDAPVYGAVGKATGDANLKASGACSKAEYAGVPGLREGCAAWEIAALIQAIGRDNHLRDDRATLPVPVWRPGKQERPGMQRTPCLKSHRNRGSSQDG